MASRTRKRPHRGEPGPNVLIHGDTGIFGGPQGGAEPGASESGDLDAREYGVPQADIPGGVVHLANAEAVADKTPDKARRPADYHKYHGVPSDDGQYHPVPGTEVSTVKPVPEPKVSDAVPVYMVEGPGSKTRIRMFTGMQRRSLQANGADGVVRIADRDPRRKSIWLQNESNTRANLILVGDRPAIEAALDQGASASQPGFSIVGNSSSYEIDCQDELFACNLNAAAVTLSWAYLTEIEVAFGGPE